MNSETGNTSGHGPSTKIPQEVQRWNWGRILSQLDLGSFQWYIHSIT